MKKRILFISTVNLTTNPRILKEITFALYLGYEVSFVGFQLGNWSDQNEVDILLKLGNVKTWYLDATRKNYLRWFTDSVRERTCRIISRWKKRSIPINAIAHNKRSLALLRFSKILLPEKYDFVIAHTLGALYPAKMIARKNDCPFAFDMEDYHPGEYINNMDAREPARREFLLKENLSNCYYVSAASGLIAKYTRELCGNNFPVYPILNFFPRAEFAPPLVTKSERIQLVWFSQNIATGRGLELILSVWRDLQDNFELSLIGHCDAAFEAQFVKPAGEGIRIIPPMKQEDLHLYMGNFDIGLAIDLSGRDLNRDLALTNKILTYFQAGLFILGTDTAEQQAFLQENKDHGIIVAQHAEAFLKALKEIRLRILHIRTEANFRFHRAAKRCWETESLILKDLWNKAMPQTLMQ